VGRPILVGLAPEVGVVEVFRGPGWFCSLSFGSGVAGGSHLVSPDHWRACF